MNCYELPALKCTYGAQDIYFDYLHAKKVFNMKNANFRYAIIGVTAFTFMHDQSAGGGGVM